ncbi:MAG: type IX secretion system outer membrane channel protein PorV [Bacteroidia bacterium]|nr:type IX secretion system outer membrane channel protein PorV [Bacteroidia bacterium]
MLLKKVASFSLIVLLVNETLPAQNISRDSLLGQTNTITTAVPFLLIAPDARAGAMGDAGVASSPDANSIHWNPAKLAFVDKDFGVSLSYTPWLRALVPDIYVGYLAGYKKLKNDQTLGISLMYFSLGSITFTDVGGNVLNDFNPNEFSVDVAYARKLGDNFSGGLALRYIYSNLTGGIALPTSGSYSHAGRSVAADISGFYHTDFDLSNKKSVFSAGLNISNIGSKISYTETGNKDFIPTNFRLGACLKSDLDEYNTLSFMADINKLLVPTPPVFLKRADGTDSLDSDHNRIVHYGKDPNVSIASAIFSSWSDAPGGFAEEIKEFTYSLGIEYWYDKQFAIRAGYFHEAATKGNRQYFTVGAGVKYNVFGIDFAYLIPTEQKHPLENTLRFTLLVDLDGLKKDKDEEKTNE